MKEYLLDRFLLYLREAHHRVVYLADAGGDSLANFPASLGDLQLVALQGLAGLVYAWKIGALDWE